MATNRMMGDNKVDTAREKIREWGAGVKQRQPWGEHAWHLLGHALQYAHEAIENDPTYQRPWTLLADIYHRIGKVDLARQCLAKSYALATPGPRFPGNFYREVEKNIRSEYPFNFAGGLEREISPPWFEEKYKRYWITAEVALKNNYESPASVPTVLISYARENQKEAERLRADLKGKKFGVWKDTHELLPGEEWEKKIKEAFEKSDFVLLCFSNEAVSKIGFFQVEVKEALRLQSYRPNSQVYLIPVRLENCEIPSDVRKFHWVDMFPGWTDGVERIASTILRYRKP